METNVSILQASNRRNVFISMSSSADGLHLAQVDPRFACFESQSAVRRKNRPEMAIKKKASQKKEAENSKQIISILQVVEEKPIHLNVIICRPLRLEQVSRALHILRDLRHIHHCKSFLLAQRALQRLCNQKEGRDLQTRTLDYQAQNGAFMDEKSEISRRESRIINPSIGSSWTRDVRDLRPRTSDYKFQDRAFMDEKSVLVLSGRRSAFVLLQSWGFFIHGGSVIWLNVVIDHQS